MQVKKKQFKIDIAFDQDPKLLDLNRKKAAAEAAAAEEAKPVSVE